MLVSLSGVTFGYVADPIFIALPPVPPWGSYTIPIAIPDQPAWCGLKLAYQAFLLDPAAVGPVGTAQTNGLVQVLGY